MGVESAAIESASQPDDVAARGAPLRRAAYLTATVGIVHALLFILSFLLVSRVPGARASDDILAAFYASGRERLYSLVGLYLSPFAGIAFIWFIVALRMWISGHVRRENALLSNIQFVCGILYVALFFITGAAYAATAASVEFASAVVSPAMMRELPLFGSTLAFVYAMRMAAMFVFTTTNIWRTTAALPPWFALLSYALGFFLLLSASFRTPLAIVFPVWVLILCVLILLRARRIPADLRLPPRAPV